jgi:hypothetical protein
MLNFNQTKRYQIIFAMFSIEAIISLVILSAFLLISSFFTVVFGNSNDSLELLKLGGILLCYASFISIALFKFKKYLIYIATK